MDAGETARHVEVSGRAVSIYQSLGLAVPPCTANGYRSCGPHELRLVEEIKTLVGVGLPVKGTRPFLERLSGQEAGDACPVVTYAKSCCDICEKTIRKSGQRIKDAAQEA